MLLFVVLILRLAAGLPTICIDHDNLICFKNDGVWKTPLRDTMGYVLNAFMPDYTWILFASDTHSMPPVQLSLSHLFIVHAANPSQAFRHWDRAGFAPLWSMRPWTVAEVIMA